MGKTELQKFNRTNFVKEICHLVQMDRVLLGKEIKEYVWPRLGFLQGRRNRADRFFLIEESYIETEWKDMISVHYINTSYHVHNSVIRVHLFMSSEISQKDYLGFFTLRKINETRIMLSFIYPNWPKIYYGKQQLYVMTYKKKVHIEGEEIAFYTYPLFIQDNITVACAQVCMISLTKYLHHKYDYNQIRISELYSAFSSGKTKMFPSFGLRPTQMIEIFNYYSIPIQYQAFPKTEDVDTEYDKFRSYIDFSVESAMPVILGITLGNNKRHVIQIIGHTSQDRECYIVYDDSGCFLHDMGIQGFVACVSWEKIKVYVLQQKSFIIYPLHEKVYIFYEDFKEKFLEMYQSVEPYLELEYEQFSDVKKSRFFLADNREVKSFLKNNVLYSSEACEVKQAAERLLEMNMPHYIWCSEVPNKNGHFLFFADPTYGKLTTKNIFLNTIPIQCEKSLGLLKYE